MESSGGAIVRKWLGVDILGRKRWVGRRLVGSIRDRESKELAARVITCCQVKKSGILGELRDVERLSQDPSEDDKIRNLTASSSTDRSQRCVSV